MEWLHQVCAVARAGECLTLEEDALPGPGRAVALSPHPDDPEAIAVTLRLLARGGWNLHWAILTSGWSGVEDDFVGHSPEAKGRAREAEQRMAARLFPLPDDHLTFLHLRENCRGEMAVSDANRHHLYTYLDRLAPDLILLPHREDTNATHRLVFALAEDWVKSQFREVVMLGNEDPKTTGFQPHLQVCFGEDTAAWKSRLLECHRSQSVRNQHVRGITFAERILAMNRACPNLLPGQYAERFQVNCRLL